MPSICLLIPAEVMAWLAEELITEEQKNSTLYDKGHPLMHASMFFTFLDSQ